MYKRLISLPNNTGRSFFLWGPRQAGKSTLLHHSYPQATVLDLLKTEEFIRYKSQPEQFRRELEAHPTDQWILVDEIQKVPELLDSVQWLITNKKLSFILCGSSARKLKRGHANLLGGRAMRFELKGLVSQELENDFDLVKVLNRGYLPEHYLCREEDFLPLRRAYVSDYLKEEIAGEAVVRNLDAFTRFLDKASFSDTEVVNCSTIARDVGVSSHTVKEYFEILVDTLQGNWLPAYTKKPKRKTRTSPKFYFSDVAVVNQLMQRGTLSPKTELFGKAFENWVHHELKTYLLYRDPDKTLSFWSTGAGTEVDFVLGEAEIAIEAKSTDKVTDRHLKGLREFKEDYRGVEARYIVCLEPRSRKTEDGITILSIKDFIRFLWVQNLKEGSKN